MRAESIIVIVCRQFGLTRAQLLGKDRRKTVALARQIAMYLCRVRLRMSYPEIGRAFQRDHTTVMSAVRRIADGRVRQQWLDEQVDAIAELLTRGAMYAHEKAIEALEMCA